MSLLPFAPAHTATAGTAAVRDRTSPPSDRGIEPAPTAHARGAARLAHEARTTRAHRTDRTDRNAPASGEERAGPVASPPDFAALMALLATNGLREVQAQRTALGNSRADEPPAELEAERDTAVVTDSHAPSTDAEDTGALGTDAHALDAHALDANVRGLGRAPTTVPQALPRDLPMTVSDRARAVLTALDADARGTGATALGSVGAGAPGAQREATATALTALADRVRTGNAGELLARGDRAAAGVRSALDALLDAAGTPRGRALAESGRPAFTEAVTRSANDVTTAVRDPDALAPAFRARLDRVIDRMRDEFGHDVQIVETVRSADRQEHLYAQGRTRPGPVVTWTLDSAHLSGEAADVMVDGQWHHPQGYARLHAIAQEEGLHTLGMRDPGHLELRGSAAAGERAVAARAADTVRTASSASTTSGVAAVARVASVARVAQVAQVARVGSSGSARASERLGRDADTPGASSPETVPGAAVRSVARAGAAAQQGDTRGGGTQRETRDADPRDATVRTARPAALDNLSAIGALSPTATRILEGDAPRGTMPVGTDIASRAEAIAVLREDAPLRALTSLTMQLDSPDGPEQVRVTLRGGVVDTQVTTASGALADRLRLQTADLQDALGRHGLDTETVKVQQTTRTHEGDAVRQALSDRGETLRAAGASAGQQGGAFEQAPRDRQSARPQAERDPRQADDDLPHQRRRNDRQEQR